MNAKKTVLIVAGPSGGHIYPALAVAEKLKDQFQVHLAHSGSLLGRSLLNSTKFPIHEISIGGLAQGQSFFKKIKTVFNLPLAFIHSLRLIQKIKTGLVFGTGGSVTGPLLLTAVLMFRKTALWEGNISAGLANRWLAPFVSKVFTVFPEVEALPLKKQQLCGYPLRDPKPGFQKKPPTEGQKDFSRLPHFVIRNPVLSRVCGEAWVTTFKTLVCDIRT